MGTRVWGLGTYGRETRDAGDARLGTWGHQVRDAGTCGTGTRDFKHRDAGDARTIMIIEKVGGKCDISHFSREYVVVKATYPALLRVPPCLFTEFTKRRLCEDPLH